MTKEELDCFQSAIVRVHGEAHNHVHHDGHELIVVMRVDTAEGPLVGAISQRAGIKVSLDELRRSVQTLQMAAMQVAARIAHIELHGAEAPAPGVPVDAAGGGPKTN